MALQALRLLLLAASFTHVTALFYGVVFFNPNGNVNWLTTGVVDSILAFAGALIFFWRMGRRAEQRERLARDPIYMGNVIIRKVGAATSSLVENDGAELTSYAAMTMDTYATKIPDGVLPGFDLGGGGGPTISWLAATIRQVAHRKWAATTLTTILSNNVQLLDEYVDEETVSKFIQLICDQGPQKRFMAFFQAICSCGGQQIISNQELCLSRLVLDRRHVSLVCVYSGEIVGGITYRPVKEQQLSEIVFCAVSADHQVQGYGTRIMNQIKEECKRTGIEGMLTYADNHAVGYFRKQGFKKNVIMKRERW